MTNRVKMNLGMFFGIFSLIMAMYTTGVNALPPKIQQLYDYCRANHSVNLVDGTEGEVVCRNGDPLSIFDDPQITELWDALSTEQQQRVVDTDHCQELFSDMGQTVVEACRERVDPSTGIVRDPIDPGNNTEAPTAANPGGGTSSGGGTDRFTCTGDACVNDNPITKFLFVVIDLLIGAIGIIIVAVIILAGIQYTTSGGNPQLAAQAKKRIINAVIALVAFFFLFAFLQWSIQGGIFR